MISAAVNGKYSLSELVARSVEVYARRWPTSLATDFARLSLHHPPELSQADADYSAEPGDHVRLSSRVMFLKERRIVSHLYNSVGGALVMILIRAGESFEVYKRDKTPWLTAERILGEGESRSILFVENIAEEIYDEDPGGWAIDVAGGTPVR